MPQPAPTDHSADAIDPAAAVARLATLPAGRSATVIGLPPTSLLEAASALGARRLLLIEPGGSIDAQEAIARILEDLADLALATWPNWPSPDATPLGPTPWRRAADRLAAIGRRLTPLKLELHSSERRILSIIAPKIFNESGHFCSYFKIKT